jgi:hypothetical protein
MKKVAISQSNYIPWKGYFDMIAAVDEFIIYDDMQFTRRDWRNRNYIKTPQGLQLLTVPVCAKGKYHEKIRDIRIDGSDWAVAHWKALFMNYRRAPYFTEIALLIEPLYLNNNFTHISQLNRHFIETICSFLEIKTNITNSWDYELLNGKTERLASLCQQASGTNYFSGPSARNYINEKIFLDFNIKLTWFDYEGFPEHPQLWGKFTHEVTILDLLFNCGKNASNYMRYIK